MPQSDSDVLAALSGLRSEYLSGLPDRFEALSTLLDRWADRGDIQARDALRLEAHRLVGTGDMFSINGLSDRARDLEKAADPAAAMAALDLLRAVLLC